MKKRQMVALLAAATMLLSTVPVSAAEYTGSADQTEISGAGAVVDYDKTPIYRVTLPTSAALNFTIDPYGLMQMATGSANGQSFEGATGTANLVVATDAGLNIVNKSSVPVLVDAKFTVTNDGSANLVTGVSALTDASGAATEAGLYLTLKGTSASADDVSGASWAAEPIVLTEGTKAVQFKLNKAAYKVVRNDNDTFKLEYDTTTANNFDGTVLQIDGAVNKADWTEYVSGGKSIKISAVFSYKQCETEVETTGTINGLVSGAAVVETNFTSTRVGVIEVAGGDASTRFASLNTIKADFGGKTYEFKDKTTINVTDGVGTLTVNSSFLNGWATAGQNPVVTINYTTAGGQTVEDTVTLITH